MGFFKRFMDNGRGLRIQSDFEKIIPAIEHLLITEDGKLKAHAKLIVIFININNQIKNMTAAGQIKVGMNMQHEGLREIDLDIAVGASKFIVGAWLESKNTNSDACKAVYKELDRIVKNTIENWEAGDLDTNLPYEFRRKNDTPTPVQAEDATENKPIYTQQEIFDQLGELAKEIVSTASSASDLEIAVKASILVSTIIVTAKRHLGLEVQPNTIFSQFASAVEAQNLSKVAEMTKAMSNALGRVDGLTRKGALVYFWFNGQ